MVADAFQVPEMRRVRVIHMIGIGGAGMSGIAEVLGNLGYEVNGSDIRESVSAPITIARFASPDFMK